MRARNHIPIRAAGAGVLAAAALAAPAAAAPAPGGGVPQITDVAGDGHHDNTDVVSAWLSEDAGRLQAVIRPRVAVWEPAHDDSDAAGFALLHTAGGEVRYVRGVAGRGVPVRFDRGTWSAAGGFASAGPVAGVAEADALVIDVPGVAPGSVLARPFVLTYDGGSATDPHWVDRGPGGTDPAGTEFGADVVAGSCAPGGPRPGGGGPGTTTTAVVLDAPRRVKGGGKVAVGGRVVPARAGVAVDVTATARRSVTRRAVTQADGTFSLLLPIRETTRVRAVAESIGSQTKTLRVKPVVRIRVRERAGGAVKVKGRIRPKLPGRVLLLRRGAVEPTATARTRGGRFTLRLRSPRKGRYQVVFIPSGKRAERATSNSGVVR
ncbi:MAG: hypothetical protein ABW081_12405 [Solirubrobacteraceae bacterium]